MLLIAKTSVMGNGSSGMRCLLFYWKMSCYTGWQTDMEDYSAPVLARQVFARPLPSPPPLPSQKIFRSSSDQFQSIYEPTSYQHTNSSLR